MFTVNEDRSIYVTRGDIVFFEVSAADTLTGINHKFQAGDVLRIKVFGKKDAETVVLQKDFPVTDVCEKVTIFLGEEDTKIGEVISKPKDYWYEVELNPYDNPQTIIGYDEDGPKVFKLFPEGDDIPEWTPEPEDIPVVDEELDMASTRPIQNQAVARAVANLEAGYEKVYAAVAELYVTPQMYGAVGDGECDDTEAIQAAIDACKRVSGATVCIPAGIYKTTAPLTIYSHTRLLGGGERGKSDEGYSGTHIQYEGDSSKNIIRADGGYGIEMKDIRISGTAAKGISMSGVSECYLENVCVNGGCNVGVYFEGTISHLNNLYASGNNVGVWLQGCHSVTVSNLNAWENTDAGIQVSGNCANVHICDSWIENSAIGILFAGSLVCHNCTIDTTSFTAGSTYANARFISADYGGGTVTGLLQGLVARSCVVKINKPTYGVYIDTPNYNTIATFEDCAFFTQNAYTYAIYSANKYNRLALLRLRCEDYSAVQNPVFGGSGNQIEVALKSTYTEVSMGRPIRVLPLTGTVENLDDGQLYYSGGRLKLTDGSKANTIPVQGAAIYGVSVNDVTLPELAQKVNDLLVILRASNAIT